MDNPEVTTKDLMGSSCLVQTLTGPLVMGKPGIHKAYETGKGIYCASFSYEKWRKLKQVANVSLLLNLPYMVNKNQST